MRKRVFLAFLLHSSFVLAQQDMATITGIVRDPSGAVLPGVVVMATNQETGIATTAFSNDTGLYVITPLKIGAYTVEAELLGFKTMRTPNVQLHAGDRARVDFTLELGEVNQEVTVEATAPLLESETSAIGQVVENRAVEELPLKGRNFQTLAMLSAGVVPALGHRDQMGGFNANGQRALQNNFMIDGIDNNSNILGLQDRKAQVLIPSVDAVQEFKVTTSNYSAEFGRNAGAVMNVSIKSGTNEFHGTAYDYVRNDIFDARDTFNYDDRDGDGKADAEQLRRNQFGATFGGPVIKDKTFFFGSWEAVRLRLAQSYLVIIPTEDERSGIFDQALVGRKIKDPLTGKAFPDNVIPQDRIDPVAAKLAALYPSPNFSGAGRNNFVSSPPWANDRDQFDFRVDHSFSDNDKAFVRYSFMLEDEVRHGALPPPLIGSGANTRAIDDNVAHSLAISETHIFTPSTVNEARFGLSQLRTDKVPLSPEHVNDEFGIKGIPHFEEIPGLPLVQLAGAVGYLNIGDANFSPNLKVSRTLHFMDNLSLIRGNHNLKVGADIRNFKTDIFGSAQARGRINFNGRYTGVSLADFLLGWANIADLSNIQQGDLRAWAWMGYFQDDWKIAPRLTLNLGLRYELATPFWDVDDRQNNFITDLGHPNFGQLIRAGQFGDSIEDRALMGLDTNNWAPRIGLAYRITPKTVIRLGAGVFYGGPENIGASSRLVANPPFFSRVMKRGTAKAPAIIFSEGFPANMLGDLETIPPDADINSWAFEFPITQTNQWTVNVQHELPARILASVAYVGNTGNYLNHNREVNIAGIGDVDTEPQRRPWPQFSSVGLFSPYAHSSYNSLQMKLDKRFSHSISFLASYTWSHSLDNAGEPFGQEAGITTPWDYDNDYGDSPFDVRHRFVSSFLWEMPFGRGQPWLDRAGVVDAIVGGWQLNGILAAQTGTPFTPGVSNSYDHLGTLGVGIWRPDRLADGNLPSDQRTADRWFDASAFAKPCDADGANCRIGTAGRTILRSPGMFNLDLGLMKNFWLTEDKRIQFRWETFNVTNTPFWADPNATIDNPQVGIIRSTRGDPRQMQFALKFIF
ncbi:MAG: TonB-dependent receptor domain-containing protein [Acidobacteriota bacterium]